MGVNLITSRWFRVFPTHLTLRSFSLACRSYCVSGPWATGVSLFSELRCGAVCFCWRSSMYQGYFEKSEKELITNKGSCLNTDSFFWVTTKAQRNEKFWDHQTLFKKTKTSASQQSHLVSGVDCCCCWFSSSDIFHSLLRFLSPDYACIHPGKLTAGTQKWRFGRWFSFLIGWFLGFHGNFSPTGPISLP